MVTDGASLTKNSKTFERKLMGVEPLPPPRIPALAALAERRRASSSRVQRSPPSDNQFSNPLRLLRRDDERRGEQAARQTADERAPLHHWMISSARCSSDRGIVSPSALAVLRLITSSNFVGCSTGRSPGLAPLRILSTCPPARRSTSKVLGPYEMRTPPFVNVLVQPSTGRR